MDEKFKDFLLYIREKLPCKDQMILTNFIMSYAEKYKQLDFIARTWMDELDVYTRLNVTLAPCEDVRAEIIEDYGNIFRIYVPYTMTIPEAEQKILYFLLAYLFANVNMADTLPHVTKRNLENTAKALIRFRNSAENWEA